jgi:hypothetical protein
MQIGSLIIFPTLNNLIMSSEHQFVCNYYVKSPRKLKTPLTCKKMHCKFYEKKSPNVRRTLFHWVYTYLRNAIPLWHRCFLYGDYFVFLHLLQDADTPCLFSTINSQTFLPDLNYFITRKRYHYNNFPLPNQSRPNYGSQHSGSGTCLYPCALPKSRAWVHLGSFFCKCMRTNDP